MVVSNGFITNTEQDVLPELLKICKGKDIRTIPIPCVYTMTYYVSECGEVFGSQKMKNIILTKPIKLERRYSYGQSFRAAYGNDQYVNTYMPRVMYCTFILRSWDENIEIKFKDGNPYNHELSNLYADKSNVIPVEFLSRMEQLQDVYKSYFNEVAWYPKKYYNGLSFSICKDYASDAFFYLCEKGGNYTPDNFIGLWKWKTKMLAIDNLKFYHRKDGLSDVEDGEECYHSDTMRNSAGNLTDYRIAMQNVSGDAAKRILYFFSHNIKPTEIAEIEGKHLGTITSCLSRNLVNLKKII